MIRVADFIAQHLVRSGIRDLFLVTGGGAMHLNDAIGRAKGLRWTCCHHEQAAAMAAEAYCRLTGRIAAVNVTTGPGGTNAITGVWGAHVDSIGMVVVSGQVKWETCVGSTGLPLRQLGDQEVDIVSLVRPVTKYAAIVTDPQSIRFHLEKAIHLARSGRPGPTWIDVPMNVQGALVDPDSLPGFDPSKEPEPGLPDPSALGRTVPEILDRLAAAKQPVLFAGAGIRIAGATDRFRRLVERWKIPVVTGFNAHDLLPTDHPCVVGRQGTIGDRAGNFAVQSSDFLLVVGSRLTIRQVSYNWKSFARAAFTVVVDVDATELAKPTIRVDLPVHADAAGFLDALLASPSPAEPPAPHREWLEWCLERKQRYPVVLPEYRQRSAPVNPYVFVDELFPLLAADDVVVTGDGTACVATFQAARLRGTQRLFSNGGSAPMGFDLPGAVGAAVAREGGRVICLAGDGSMMMNLQELQTMATNRLPIKIFVFGNRGYHSIRLTQAAWFPDSPIGFDEASGVGTPDLERLAAVWAFPFERARNHDELRGTIERTLAAPGPALAEIVLDIDQPFSPKLASRRLDDGRMVSSPLEDMHPFLDREELRRNVLIPPEEKN
jgi:acetolactate synthase-1/2/3 large subunit